MAFFFFGEKLSPEPNVVAVGGVIGPIEPIEPGTCTLNPGAEPAPNSSATGFLSNTSVLGIIILERPSAFNFPSLPPSAFPINLADVFKTFA